MAEIRTSLGPVGLLGIPVRRFRERTLDVPTRARVSQIGLEGWGTYGDTPIRVTQIGLEVWIGIDDAGPPVPVRARLGPVGLLGVPMRKFRERTLDERVAVAARRVRRHSHIMTVFNEDF